jgi:hypothetical protein
MTKTSLAAMSEIKLNTNSRVFSGVWPDRGYNAGRESSPKAGKGKSTDGNYSLRKLSFNALTNHG